MRLSIAIVSALLLLVGCATFNELQPIPPVDPTEGGFISVAEGDKMFLLLKDEKSFIRFPAPRQNNFYLVLKVPRKSLLPAYLTRERNIDDVSGPHIRDEQEYNDILSVFPIDNLSSSYLWVVPYTPDDIPLTLSYRYVTRWRYSYETRRQGFKDSLFASIMDRKLFDAIGPAYNLDAVDLRSERQKLEMKNAVAVALLNAMNELRALFPATAIAQNDTAYREYTDLVSEVEKEKSFHEMYEAILVAFEDERSTRGRPDAFLEIAPKLTAFMRSDLSIPERIREKARTVFQTRLFQSIEHVDAHVLAKQDLEPIGDVQPLKDLYDACGLAPDPKLVSVLSYIDRFNREVSGIRQFDVAADLVEKDLPAGEELPDDAVFDRLEKGARDAMTIIPSAEARNVSRYGSSPSAGRLREARGRAVERGEAMVELYGGLRSIIMSIRQKNWREAERTMSDVHRSKRIGTSASLSSQRGTLLHQVEEKMYQSVLAEARSKARAFINAQSATTTGISRLYEDQAFDSPYQLSFSTKGSDELARKRSTIVSELSQFRDVTFPATAIRSVYRSFQRNPNDKGVERARAVLEHGKRYKGKDEEIAGIVREVDATRAKPITRAKAYRSVFVLPLRRTNAGAYEYGFKVQLRIPTTAQFPVYDLNIKLPEDVASNASTTRWYTSITLDNKPIKNEGRFRITSPSAESDYVSLISPVEMDKQGRNVVEVRFEYPSERVFQVAAMAQAPIIRKN